MKMCLTTRWPSPEASAVACPFDGGCYVTGAESFVDAVAQRINFSRRIGLKLTWQNAQAMPTL
jgi:hypothetical protein